MSTKKEAKSAEARIAADWDQRGIKLEKGEQCQGGKLWLCEKKLDKKVGRALGLELGPGIECFLSFSVMNEDQEQLENLPF